MWQALKAELSDAARMNEISLGGFAPHARTSATEIASSQQNTSSVLRGIAQTLEERWLDPTLDMVWKTGPVQQLVMGITFVFCLLIPLQYAVLIGVAMSLLMFVIQQSNKITIKQWVATEGPYPIEQDPPETVPAVSRTSPSRSLPITASSVPRLPSRPPWIVGCNVLTRPSMISGKPVLSATSMTSMPASRNALQVPPVERISTPISLRPVAKGITVI